MNRKQTLLVIAVVIGVVVGLAREHIDRGHRAAQRARQQPRGDGEVLVVVVRDAHAGAEGRTGIATACARIGRRHRRLAGKE